MEGTVSLTGAMCILWSAQKRAGFLLVVFNYLDCSSSTGWTFDPKSFGCWRGQVSSEVCFTPILHAQSSKITIRLTGDKCPESNSLETHTWFGLHASRGLNLSSFGTSQPLLRRKGCLWVEIVCPSCATCI